MVECSAVLQIVQSFCKVSFKLFDRFAKSPFDSRYCLSHFIPVNMLSHRQNSSIFVQNCVRNVFSWSCRVMCMTLLSLRFGAHWVGRMGTRGLWYPSPRFLAAVVRVLFGGGAWALGCFQSNLRSSKFPSFLRSWALSCLATCEAIRSVETIFHFTCGESNLH